MPFSDKYVYSLNTDYILNTLTLFGTLYILDDYSEGPMDYETSLLPKVFPLTSHLRFADGYIFHGMKIFCQRLGTLNIF